ncbi:S-adenosyl-L-methionine-dependent methyltransferase, partial [Tribonema minus]
MEMYCGAGGFTHGVKEYLDTALATDFSQSARALYARNHPAARVIQGDANERGVQLALITEATRLGVEVGLGGPPCTHFSQAGKRETHEGWQCVLSMLLVHAAIPSLRMTVLENVLGFMSTPQWQHTLAAARALGFSFSHHVVTGDDCGLPTMRRRVFLVLTRG